MVVFFFLFFFFTACHVILIKASLVQVRISIDFSYELLNVKIVLFKTIQFSISSFNVKTVLLQTIQFSICTQFSSIWSIERTLSGVTTSEQSRPARNGSKWVLRLSQSSSIHGTTPLDCLASNTEHSLMNRMNRPHP